MTGRGPGVAVAIDRGSPALSASVFRCLGSGSLSDYCEHAFILPPLELHLQDAPVNLCFRDGGGMREIAFARVLFSDSVISPSPFPGDCGIRLGGRNCDLRIYYKTRQWLNFKWCEMRHTEFSSE